MHIEFSLDFDFLSSFVAKKKTWGKKQNFPDLNMIDEES